MTGWIAGSVTKRNRLTGPAPSSIAASICSFGTSSSDAKKITTVFPMPHRESRVSEGLNQVGELNQPGGLYTPTCARIALIGPPASNRYTNTSVEMTGGARYGR